MKILQVTVRFPPAVTGSGNHVYNISKELVRRGHKVTVATTTSLNNKDTRGFSVGQLKLNSVANLHYEKEGDGVDVYRFKPVFQFYTYLLSPSLFIYILKNAKKYDMIHAHCYMHAEPDMVAVISKLTKIPFILTAHDIQTPYSGILGLIKDMYDRSIGRVTLTTASRVIALTSENVKEYITLGVPTHKIKVIPNGVDIEKFSNFTVSNKIINPFKKTENIVLFVGRLVEYKGAQYIIKAIPKIITEYPSTTFVFVGEDQGYKDTLVSLAKKLDVLNKCVFPEKIKESDLLTLYSIADVFVLPSTGEGFGLVALESIISGTPVILADRGGLREILLKIGGYSLDMSKDIPLQIVENIKKVFSDPRIGTEIEKEKEVIKRSYTWESVAQQLERIYAETIVEKNQKGC